ncbi:MAG: transporter [Deltaproteobacteria bacterium]|nr:transporter [Deltaproteobacteria bacterium]
MSTGDEGRRDLPGILGIGAAYTASPNLRLDASLTYYLNTRADWEWEDRTDDDTTNGYDVGFSAEYTFNEKLKGSAGYMYTSTGIDPKYILAEAPELDAHSIGYGILYKIKPNVDLNFGVLKVFYSDLKEAGVKYEKEVATFAAGIQYKFD